MNKTIIVPYRRKREGKTDYKLRLAMLKSIEKRLVIRKSDHNITAQIIEYHEDGDKIIAGANSRELIKLGWALSRKSIPAAYLTGYVLGKKAIAKKIEKVIPDIGFHPSTPGSRIYAVMKGVIDAGIKVSVKQEMLPKDERVTGSHITGIASKTKDEKQMSKSKNVDIPKLFNEVKSKIK